MCDYTTECLVRWWNVSVVWCATVWFGLLTSSTAWINSFPSSCTTLATGGTSEQWGNSSVYGTNRQSAHLRPNGSCKNAYCCKVSWVCVCARSQRTSTLTWLSEPQEIWATELLEVGERVRNINKLLGDGVKHWQFVLCTDRHILHRNCSKTPRTVCRFVCYSPQWNTAFTSRLSDKNKSGFRLRA